MADLAKSQSQWNELHCWITVHHWFCHLLLHGKKKKKKGKKKSPSVCMRESPYSSCVQQTTFMHNSILTCYAPCVLGGCVDAAEGCGHICMPEKMNVCVCVCMWEGGKTILAIQPFLFNEEWKTGIQRVVRCRILMWAHPTASPSLKRSGTEVKPL